MSRRDCVDRSWENLNTGFKTFWVFTKSRAMTHRNRWFSILISMVIFHGELLVITREYMFPNSSGISFFPLEILGSNRQHVSPRLGPLNLSVKTAMVNGSTHFTAISWSYNICFYIWRAKKLGPRSGIQWFHFLRSEICFNKDMFVCEHP